MNSSAAIVTFSCNTPCEWSLFQFGPPDSAICFRYILEKGHIPRLTNTLTYFGVSAARILYIAKSYVPNITHFPHSKAIRCAPFRIGESMIYGKYHTFWITSVISADKILFHPTHNRAAYGAMQKSITHKRSRDLAFLRLLEISRCELPWKNLLKELQFLAFLNKVLFLNLTVHMLDDVFFPYITYWTFCCHHHLIQFRKCACNHGHSE